MEPTVLIPSRSLRVPVRASYTDIKRKAHHSPNDVTDGPTAEDNGRAHAMRGSALLRVARLTLVNSDTRIEHFQRIGSGWVEGRSIFPPASVQRPLLREEQRITRCYQGRCTERDTCVIK